MADIGVDHALLSIHLLQKGRAEHVLCTDVHEKPLAKAEKALEKACLSHRATFCLGDGLDAVSGHNPDAVVIAGMGGLTICSIMGEAAKVPRRIYLLQPMTDAPLLRAHLWKNGFCITDEVLSFDNGRFYPIFSVVYDGLAREESALDTFCGKAHLSRNDGPTQAYLKKLSRALEKQIAGKRRGNHAGAA